MDNTTTNRLFRDFDGFDSGGATTNSEAGKLYQTMPMSEKPDNDGYYLLLDPENIELSSLCYCLEGEWYRDFDDAMDEHHSELDTDGCSWLKPYTPPTAPVREGSDVLDKLKNYIRDELMFTMGNGRQPNEGKNNAYYNVLEAIEQLKTESPASPERGEFDAEQSLRDAIHDFLHDGLKEQGYSTGSEEEYDKLYREIRRRADIAIESLQTGKSASSEQRVEQWVSVKDKTPDDVWTECLVWCDGHYGHPTGLFTVKGVHIDPVDKGARGIDAWNRPILYITHWMPLPNKPKL